MFYKNGKHVFYCLRKKLEAGLEWNWNRPVDDGMLYKVSETLYNLATDKDKEIKERLLRNPIDDLSYGIINYTGDNIRSFIETECNIILGDYVKMLMMAPEQIEQNIYFYDKYINKYKVTIDATYYRNWDRKTRKYLNMSKELSEDRKKLHGKNGVYFLYNEKKELIYVGKSFDLSERLVSSAYEKPAYYYSFTEINNMADTNIYELYYISKYKPLWNKDCNCKDYPTVQLKELSFADIKPVYMEVR